MRNLLSFLVQKRCLNTSYKIPHLHSPIPQITKGSNFVLQFLTDTCGLPLKSAIAVSQKFHLQQKNEKKLQSVIDYLKDEGFTQIHIAKLIRSNPQVMVSNVETILKPKMEFLKQNGFVGELLTEIVVKSPNTLNRSLGSQIKPALELLRTYLGSNDKVVLAFRRCCWLFEFNVKNILRPNIHFLVKEGVSPTSIAKIITFKPTAITKEHSRTIYTVNALKNLGFQPDSPMFVHAFNVMIYLSESHWSKKMEFLQSFGWTEMDVLRAFKRFPLIMGYSEGRIRKSMEFYQNTLKLDLQTIITRPIFLGYAIDTRVRPRYLVYEILKSKKLIKEDMKLLTLLAETDIVFLRKYVIKYKEIIPDLMETYNSSKEAGKLKRKIELGCGGDGKPADRSEGEI